MKKLINCALALTAVVTVGAAQTISPTQGGGSYSAGGVQMDFTIGEPIIGSRLGAGVELYQGFQQVHSIVSTPPVSYCASSGQLVGEEWIKRVQIEKDGSLLLNHFSGRDGGYIDNTSIVPAPTLLLGDTYKVIIFPGRKAVGLNRLEGYKVWVDWNGDGDFRDAEELVFSRNLTDSKSVRGYFVVPAPANTGMTRMRVQMKYGQIPFGSCENFGRGEVEDYALQLAASASLTLGQGKAGSTLGGEMHMALYPNPTHKHLHLALRHQALGAGSIQIMNMQGQVLQQLAFEKKEAVLTKQLEVAALPLGAYVVMWRLGHASGRQAFVKQ